MNEDLANNARRVLEAAPVSLEMPAGTGKTHLLSAAVTVAAMEGKRSLVLTHTNAGVSAIRKRLKEFEAASSMVRVETLTSWALRIVRSYPNIAGVSDSAIFDPQRSDEYVEGATRALGNSSIKKMHELSFEYLFVDEYQDCTTGHHEFVQSLSTAILKTVILGDPLQAIFSFTGPLADWETDVIPHYPGLDLAQIPHRWKNSNPQLGEWLLNIRASLQEGHTFNAREHSSAGLRYVPVDRTAALTAAGQVNSLARNRESVVLLVAQRDRMPSYAQLLSGRAVLMEEVSGGFMREWLATGDFPLPPDGNPLLALWLAKFLKACAVGTTPIDSRVCKKLENGETLLKLRNKELLRIRPVVEALESLRTNPTYQQLVQSAKNIRVLGSPAIYIYRWEAWRDTIEAIRRTVGNGLTPIENFSQVREQLRWRSRSEHQVIVSRTVLVKGLEYDHIVISKLSDFTDLRDLYVALSRARKSVTIIGDKPEITLRRKGGSRASSKTKAKDTPKSQPATLF